MIAGTLINAGRGGAGSEKFAPFRPLVRKNQIDFEILTYGKM